MIYRWKLGGSQLLLRLRRRVGLRFYYSPHISAPNRIFKPPHTNHKGHGGTFEVLHPKRMGSVSCLVVVPSFSQRKSFLQPEQATKVMIGYPVRNRRNSLAMAFAMAATCILKSISAYEVCHLCRDQSFPYKPSGGIVVLNENLDLDKEVYTCEEFYWMGLQGQISSKACGPIVASHQAFCQCGEQYAAAAAASALWSASNPFGNTVTFPNSAPTRFSPPVAPPPVQWPVQQPMIQPTWAVSGTAPVAEPTWPSWPTSSVGTAPTAAVISWPIAQPSVSTPTAWTWSNPTPTVTVGSSWANQWDLRGDIPTTKPPPPPPKPTWPIVMPVPAPPLWPVVTPSPPIAAPTQPAWPVVAPPPPVVAAPTQPSWPFVVPTAPAFAPAIAYQSWPTITAPKPTTSAPVTNNSKKDKMSKSMGMDRQLRGQSV